MFKFKSYKLSLNSSVGGLFEILDDMDIVFNIIGCGRDFLMMEIYVWEKEEEEVEEIISFYLYD